MHAACALYHAPDARSSIDLIELDDGAQRGTARAAALFSSRHRPRSLTHFNFDLVDSPAQVDHDDESALALQRPSAVRRCVRLRRTTADRRSPENAEAGGPKSAYQ
jgi:hypothetical protein